MDSLEKGRGGVFDVLGDINVKLKGRAVSGLPVNVSPSPTSSSLLRRTSDRHPDKSAFIIIIIIFSEEELTFPLHLLFFNSLLDRDK